MLPIDPLAFVAHRQPRIAIWPVIERHEDASIRSAIFQPVVDEIANQLFELLSIALHFEFGV